MLAYSHLDTRHTPALAKLQSLFDHKYRLSRALIGRSVAHFGPDWATDFEGVIASLFADDASLEAALKGYAAFALDSMRRQKAFEKVREYPNKTYAEAAGEIYFNEAHMTREYLPGLLLSHFLWPHHYRQLQFFDAAFLAPMALSEFARFAEVGVGTAVYSRRILTKLRHAHGAGYDISPSSCAFALRHLDAAGAGDRFTVLQQDILADPIEPVPWLVCVEVLEHLEQPVEFLCGLRRSLVPGGRAFITAALNAAHADHIYLYRDAEEVWRHLEEAGFRLEQSFVAAAYAPPSSGVPVPMAAAFVVY
ncbi:MAG: class I SAM-dependent methyltransferase [Burkholderiales bacterium]